MGRRKELWNLRRLPDGDLRSFTLEGLRELLKTHGDCWTRTVFREFVRRGEEVLPLLEEAVRDGHLREVEHAALVLAETAPACAPELLCEAIRRTAGSWPRFRAPLFRKVGREGIERLKRVATDPGEHEQARWRFREEAAAVALEREDVFEWLASDLLARRRCGTRSEEELRTLLGVLVEERREALARIAGVESSEIVEFLDLSGSREEWENALDLLRWCRRRPSDGYEDPPPPEDEDEDAWDEEEEGFWVARCAPPWAEGVDISALSDADLARRMAEAGAAWSLDEAAEVECRGVRMEKFLAPLASKRQGDRSERKLAWPAVHAVHALAGIGSPLAERACLRLLKLEWSLWSESVLLAALGPSVWPELIRLMRRRSRSRHDLGIRCCSALIDAAAWHPDRGSVLLDEAADFLRHRTLRDAHNPLRRLLVFARPQDRDIFRYAIREWGEIVVSPGDVRRRYDVGPDVASLRLKPLDFYTAKMAIEWDKTFEQLETPERPFRLPVWNPLQPCHCGSGKRAGECCGPPPEVRAWLGPV